MDVNDMKADVDKDRELLNFLREDAIKRGLNAPKLPAKYSIEQLREDLVSSLLNMYEAPWTVSEFQDVVDAHLDEMAEQQFVNQFLFGPNYFDKNARKLKQKTWTVADGDRVLYYDFYQEKMSENPLMFSHEIDYDKHLKNHICWFPDTNCISSVATLSNLIKQCGHLGIGYRQMSRVLYLLIKHHYELLLDTATHYVGTERTLDLFLLLVDNIDLDAERSTLQNLRLAVSRKPDQNISVIGKKLCSIYQQYLKLSSGITKQEEVERSAQALALADIPNFLSDNCKAKLQRWTNEQALSGQSVTLNGAIKMVQMYELDSRNKINTTLFNNQSNQSKISMSQLSNVAMASWNSNDVNHIGLDENHELPPSPKSFPRARSGLKSNSQDKDSK